MKILWFDTETTGVKSEINDIVQIAGMIEVNGEIVEEFEFFQKPRSKLTVESKALEVQGKTLDEIMAYPENGNIYKSMWKIFNKHVEKFNPCDKFMPAGQNVQFDKNFMFALWGQQKNFFLGAYLFGGCIDTLSAAAIAVDIGLIKQPIDRKGKPSYKLEAIARRLEVDLVNAHNAINDIKTTRECYLKLKTMFSI
jgi:DNA polymerase-3 subunit epsilon